MPARIARVFDLKIPIKNYVTAWEAEQVEKIIASGDLSQTRADVLVIQAFASSRLDVHINVDEAMQLPIKDDEIAKAVEVLTKPFFDAQRSRAKRRVEAQMEFLSQDALRDEIEKTQALLIALESLLAERQLTSVGPS